MTISPNRWAWNLYKEYGSKPIFSFDLPQLILWWPFLKWTNFYWCQWTLFEHNLLLQFDSFFHYQQNRQAIALKLPDYLHKNWRLSRNLVWKYNGIYWRRDSVYVKQQFCSWCPCCNIGGIATRHCIWKRKGFNLKVLFLRISYFQSFSWSPIDFLLNLTNI